MLVKVGKGSRSGVKGGGGVKVVSQGRGQGWGWVRDKDRGVKGGVMVGGLGVGVRGQSGIVGGGLR